MSASREAEFTVYVQARTPWLRRVAYLLCQDPQAADDLVQIAITRLFRHWEKASAANSIDAYVRTILVRCYLSEQRTTWARRVSLFAADHDVPVKPIDLDAAIDVRAALKKLPPRQRATLVLRFYCDLSVEQAAQELNCTTGTIKSQTSKGLGALRRVLGSLAAEEA